MVAAVSPPPVQPRLFLATGARITPQVEWVEIQVKSALNRVQGMPFQWSINPYRGCEHACVFCYSRRTHWFLDQDGINQWSSRIFVKVNAPEVLRRELAHPHWRRELVAVGTATDPYQPAEGHYRLTRQILEALRDHRTPMSLITRSPMIIRDIDILQQLSAVADVTACFSLITLDPDLARELEPHVAPPRKRLQALGKIARAGIRATVNLAPILPGISDSERNLAEVIAAAREHGASQLWAIPLHLGEVTRDAFFAYLGQQRPALMPEYQRFYRGKYAPSAYQQRIQDLVRTLKRRAGFPEPATARDRRRAATAPEPRPVQLRLFSPAQAQAPDRTTLHALVRPAI